MAKQEFPAQGQGDEALFEALSKNKKRKRRRIILTVVSVVLVLAILAVVGVTLLQKKVREQFATQSGEVLSYEVAAGTIRTVVSGSGSLTDEVGKYIYAGVSGRLNAIFAEKDAQVAEVMYQKGAVEKLKVSQGDAAHAGSVPKFH